MKRLFLVLMLVLSTAVILANCGGGGGGGAPAPVTFSAPSQAAGANATANSAVAMTDTQFALAMDMGLSSLPAGYAPRLARKMSRAGDAGSLDPKLKKALDSMAKFSQAPALRSAVKKAKSFSSLKKTTSVNDTVTCDSGNMVITGTNNSDELNATSDIANYTITFNNCRDNFFYAELSGTLQVSDISSRTTLAFDSSLTANLTEKMYSSSTDITADETFTLSGTFRGIDQLTSGSITANGSFVMTFPAQGGFPETVMTYAFNNISDTWTSADNADGSVTEVDDLSGTFTMTLAITGEGTYQFSLGLSLTDEWQYMNDVAGTEKNWMDGTVTMSWAPDMTAYGCLAGALNISTLETDPIAYTYAGGFCPVSGTLSINNATIEFGSTSGTSTDILVSVNNGTPQVYSSCSSLDLAGSMCTL
jgi:hypothetical protein